MTSGDRGEAPDPIKRTRPPSFAFILLNTNLSQIGDDLRSITLTRECKKHTHTHTKAECMMHKHERKSVGSEVIQRALIGFSACKLFMIET